VKVRTYTEFEIAFCKRTMTGCYLDFYETILNWNEKNLDHTTLQILQGRIKVVVNDLDCYGAHKLVRDLLEILEEKPWWWEIVK